MTNPASGPSRTVLVVVAVIVVVAVVMLLLLDGTLAGLLRGARS